ncbi:uncharacterized protein LOC106180164 isoform X2 [Lingula anatina]|nr:uncharacterized protein LOC106180164 isoform X2 [Lingula anatina]XP_013419543.1 uncharacterized protein LOC106180164 isoform X2 [Lingula anatina]|eukprot:XP_013419534.1 uncharacterized protein LOC106180164 isoform X2 [Lingula anatina]
MENVAMKLIKPKNLKQEKSSKHDKKNFQKGKVLHAKLHIKYWKTKEIAKKANKCFTREMLQDLAQFKRAADYFIKRGAHLIKLNEGCVECVLMFDAAEKLQSFWTEYKSGDLSKFLTNEYITQELEEMEGEEMLYVDVYICEQELATAWEFFTNPGEPETQTNVELPSTSGSQIKQERPLTVEQNIEEEFCTVTYQKSYHIMKSEKETATMCEVWGSIFEDISTRVSCMWKELALHLKFTEEDREAIVSQHPNEEEAQCLECLQSFLERNYDQPVEQITAQLLTALYMMHQPTFAETVVDLLTMESLPVCHELIQRPMVCDTLSSDASYKDYEKYDSGEDNDSINSEICLGNKISNSDDKECQKEKSCHAPIKDGDKKHPEQSANIENNDDGYGERNRGNEEADHHDSEVDETLETLNYEQSSENEESLRVAKLQSLLSSENPPEDKRHVEDIVKLLELSPELLTKLNEVEQKKLASMLLCVGCDSNENAMVCRNLKQNILKLASPKHKVFASLLKSELLELLHNAEGDNTLHLSENWKLLSQTPKKELKTWLVIAEIFIKQLSKNDGNTKLLKILARKLTLLKLVLQQIKMHPSEEGRDSLKILVFNLVKHCSGRGVGLAAYCLLLHVYQRQDLHTNYKTSDQSECMEILAKDKDASKQVLKQLHHTHNSRALSEVEKTLFLDVLSQHAEVHGGCYYAGAERNAVVLLQCFLTSNDIIDSEQSKCMQILAKDEVTSEEVLKQLYQTHKSKTLSTVERTLFLNVMSQHVEVHGSYYSGAERKSVILLQYFLTSNDITDSEQSECMEILAKDKGASEEVLKQLHHTHNSRALSEVEKTLFLHVLSQHAEVHGGCYYAGAERNAVVLLQCFLTSNDITDSEQSKCMQILAKDEGTSEEALKQLYQTHKYRTLSAVERTLFLNVLSQHAEVHGRFYSGAERNTVILLQYFLTNNDITDSEQSKCMQILAKDRWTSKQVLKQLYQTHKYRTLSAVERTLFLNVLSQHAEVHGRFYSGAKRNTVILLQNFLTSNDITDSEQSKCMQILAKDRWTSKQVLKQLYQTHKYRTLSAVERTLFLDVLSQHAEVHGSCNKAAERNAVILLHYYFTNKNITDTEQLRCMDILAKDKFISESVLKQFCQHQTIKDILKSIFLDLLSQHVRVHGISHANSCDMDMMHTITDIFMHHLTSQRLYVYTSHRTPIEFSSNDDRGMAAWKRIFEKEESLSMKALEKLLQYHQSGYLSLEGWKLMSDLTCQHIKVHGRESLPSSLRAWRVKDSTN